MKECGSWLCWSLNVSNVPLRIVDGIKSRLVQELVICTQSQRLCRHVWLHLQYNQGSGNCGIFLPFVKGMSLGRCPEYLRRQRYFSEWSESISLGEKTSGSSGSISVGPGVTLDTGRPWSGHLAYCAVAHYNCTLGTPCSTLRRTPRTHYNCTLLDTPEAHSLCRRLHKCTLQNDTF